MSDQSRHLFDTERLSFRTLSPSDTAFLHELLSTAVDEPLRRVNDHCRVGLVGGSFEIVYDSAYVDAWVARSRQREERDGHSFWLATRKHSAEPVGIYGPLRMTVDGQSLIEIGWYTHQAHRHQGFAREAAHAVAAWTFESRQPDRVHACILSDNAPSIRVAKSIGMSRLRTNVDHAGVPHDLYGMTRTELPPR